MKTSIINEINETEKLIKLGANINKRFEHTGFEPINVEKLIQKKANLEDIITKLNNNNFIKE